MLTVTSLTGCSGDGAGGTCEELSNCGGDPTGVWQVSEICNNPVSARPLQLFAVPESGVAQPATASGGWCWDISFNKDGTLASPAVPQPNPTVVNDGTVEFNVDPMTGEHQYLYKLTAWSRTEMYIARSCLGSAGANMSCSDLASKMQTFIGADQRYQTRHGGAPGDPTSFVCTPVGADCDCSFDYTEVDQTGVGDKGRWVVDGGRIHHYSETFTLTTSFRAVREADFCVSNNGQTLELSGSRGTTLALKAGLRTLKLRKVP
jgi:hypothetical protein